LGTGLWNLEAETRDQDRNSDPLGRGSGVRRGYYGGRAETCTYKDLPYTVELNIGGKFVHGYNWQMSRFRSRLALATSRKAGGG
jgi:hypothetical protein